jgi:transcriptional regulator CtsR
VLKIKIGAKVRKTKKYRENRSLLRFLICTRSGKVKIQACIFPEKGYNSFIKSKKVKVKKVIYMKMSDVIAQFIAQQMAQSKGEIELQRNELADRFQCVPSQINYVIATRFSPEQGYLVHSRRGGGGYIRISRILADRPSMLMHAVNSVGEELSVSAAAAILSNLVSAGALRADDGNLILAALGDAALAPAAPVLRARLRARIFKICLIQAGGEKKE